MAGVMGRLYNRQYQGIAPAAGADYYGGSSVANAALNASLGVAGMGADASVSARTSGMVVVALLILAWVGYPGLKGG